MSKYTSFLQRLEPREKAELLLELSELPMEQADDFGLEYIEKYDTGIRRTIDHWGEHDGLHWGYQSLDDMTLGMTNGEVMLISGDSNHGKTQLALNLAFRQAKSGNKVFFITLEMTQEQIGARIVKIAMQSGMAYEAAIKLPVLLQRAKRLDYRNVPQIVSRAKKEGATMVFLDHVHSFARSAAANKTTEVAAISMEIKRAALENNLPVIALAQCRKLEDYNGKPRKPNKNDLKDAAELYQDSDLVLMVWRDKFSDGGVHQNQVEVRIWKNRLREMRAGHQEKHFISVEGAGLIENIQKNK